MRDERRLGLGGDRLVDDDRVLGRAEQPVVEGLAGEDVGDGLRHVGGALDVGRRVAGADAVGRLAGAVGGAHQPHAAGREDDADALLAHQLLRAFERDRRQARDAAFGQAGGARGRLHDLGDARDAALRRRVRAHHDRAARLDGDQDLVDRRRGRVGGRDDRGDDAERLGDLDDLGRLEASQHADRLHRLDELVDRLGGEAILADLVGDDAEAGLLVRRAGPAPRTAACHCRGHGVDDGVDLGLRQLGELALRHLGARDEVARLLHRRQIGVGRPRGGWRSGGAGGGVHGHGLAQRASARRVSAGCARLRRAAAG